MFLRRDIHVPARSVGLLRRGQMSQSLNDPVIQVSNISKTFPNGRRALDGVSIALEAGEMVALIGASGSGKSTLIRHIGGLIVANKGADGGSITVFGRKVQADGRLAGEVSATRRRLGVIFQQFNLVPRLTVLTNVLAGRLGRMPAWRGVLMQFSHQEKQRAMQALARVGIASTARQRAATLSGGQQQRAAIARCIVQESEAILADEPIASLRPGLRAPRHGDAVRYQPDGRHGCARFAASGRIRPTLLQTHYCHARRPYCVRWAVPRTHYRFSA